jgi:hypothetical protein
VKKFLVENIEGFGFKGQGYWLGRSVKDVCGMKVYKRRDMFLK